MNKIRFTPKDILQKDFRQKIRGYDPTEVDSFLDMVIRDYQSFDKVIEQLRGENNSLRYHLNNAQTNHQTMQPIRQPQKNSFNMNNHIYSDILKRLNRLEERMP